MEFHHSLTLFPMHSTVYFCTGTDPSLKCGRQIRRYNTNRRAASNLSAETRVRSKPVRVGVLVDRMTLRRV